MYIFFDGPLRVSCMVLEVKIDMHGQSNNCLRLCNVKMKKFTGAETGHISQNVQVIWL